MTAVARPQHHQRQRRPPAAAGKSTALLLRPPARCCQGCRLFWACCQTENRPSLVGCWQPTVGLPAAACCGPRLHLLPLHLRTLLWHPHWLAGGLSAR